MEEDELLNLDLLWKNTPYAKIRKSLAAWDHELTFFGPPVISDMGSTIIAKWVLWQFVTVSDPFGAIFMPYWGQYFYLS